MDEIDTNEIDTNEIDTNEIDTNEIDIDNNWVDTYKKNEEHYNDFYNEKVSTIQLFFLYINSEKELVNIKRELLTLNVANILPREQLIALIKEKQHFNQVKYKLFSLVRYNINLQPEEIDDFICPNNVCETNVCETNVCETNVCETNVCETNVYTNRFFTPESHVNDIYFQDTISIFQDLNSLYIIFKADPPNKKKSSTNNFTKKLKASIKRRHTRYKVYNK